MTLVLVIQALVLQRWRSEAVGTNVFNMGVLAGFGAYVIMCGCVTASGRTRGILGRRGTSQLGQRRSRCASACAAELAVSGTSPWLLVFPVLVGTHAVIGVVERL